MDKRSKKAERPKLRKEDIGTPVNFVHVQHVGFGQRPPTSTQSACASPSFENMDSFFNQENFRRSGKFNPGKENRFSNPSALPPYSSMSNLSILGSSYEKEDRATGAGSGPLKLAGLKKSAKSSFSGSLLNLNFFPFSKSSSGNGQEKSIRGGSKSEHNSSSTRSKRLSLGVGFPISSSSGGQSNAFLMTRPLTGPPQTPSPTTETWEDVLSSGHPRPQIRRRSSSFNGESDAVTYSEIVGLPNSNPLNPPSLTLNRHMGMSNKKQKMGSQPPSLPSSPPPLSPNYEELPPPPDMACSIPILQEFKNELFPLPPESPSYVELPPPPAMKEMFPLRKMSLEFSYPPPPPPPNSRRKLSEIAASPNGDMPPPPLSPSSSPPPLPTSPPPSMSYNKGHKPRIGYNLAPLQARLVRVNAPTLPPLCVPLIRPKSQSPSGTPSTWPLEPGYPELYHSTSADVDIEQESCKKSEGLSDAPVADHIINSNPSEDINLSIQQIQQACNHSSTSIDASHIEPLSKLFQCRLSHTEWPIMMTRLFENSTNVAKKEVLKDRAFTQVYNELIQNTLELWLRLEGGQSTLERVVTAFEKTQSELSQDCNEHVTKL